MHDNIFVLHVPQKPKFMAFRRKFQPLKPDLQDGNIGHVRRYKSMMSRLGAGLGLELQKCEIW
jgi:hypothetical protein